MATKTRRPRIDRDELAALDNDGWTPAELANHYGAHIDSIHKIRRELGLPARKRPSKIDHDELKALVAEGWTTPELAEHYGAHPSSVSRIRSLLGISKNHTMTPERLAHLECMIDDGWSFAEIHRTEGAHPETLRKYFPGKAWTPQQAIEHQRALRLENPHYFNYRPKSLRLAA